MVCNGWQIVCPDGKVRHRPYDESNKQWAEDDAARYSLRIFRGGSLIRVCAAAHHDFPPDWSDPPCPQGDHRVEKIAPA